MPGPTSPGIPGWFIALAVIVGLIGLGGAIWRFAILRNGGLNPFVAEEQLEVQLSRHLKDAATPTSEHSEKTIEGRLAELDDLRERGVITAEERAAARAKILGGN